MTVTLKRGQRIDRSDVMRQWSALQYRRNDDNFVRALPRRATRLISSRPLRGPRLADRALRRRDRNDLRIRSVDGTLRRHTRRDQDLREFALCDAAADACPGHEGHQAGTDRAARMVSRQRQAARGTTSRATHAIRPGDDRGNRIVRRNRNYSRWLTGRKPGEPPPTCSNISR